MLASRPDTEEAAPFLSAAANHPVQPEVTASLMVDGGGAVGGALGGEDSGHPDVIRVPPDWRLGKHNRDRFPQPRWCLIIFVGIGGYLYHSRQNLMIFIAIVNRPLYAFCISEHGSVRLVQICEVKISCRP